MRAKKIKKKTTGITLKIIVLGDSGVGKTSLIQRFVGGFYSENLTPTIGIDFKIKPIQYDDRILRLQIWDTAGQQKFKNLTKSYFNGCMGALMVFSLCDRKSFDNLEMWLSQMKSHVNEETVKILVGSKSDCYEERVISQEECQSLAKRKGLKYVEVSSKTGQNVEQVFQDLVFLYYNREQKQYTNFIDPQYIKIEKGSDENSLRKCSC